MGFLVGGPRFEICGRVRAFTFASSLRLCLCDGVPCVINRIGFILRAVVGDALDNDFGVVAAGEGALGVGPVVFGLAFVVVRHLPLVLSVVAKMPGSLGGVFVNREIAERVDRIAFLARLPGEVSRTKFGAGTAGEFRIASRASSPFLSRSR